MENSYDEKNKNGMPGTPPEARRAPEEDAGDARLDPGPGPRPERTPGGLPEGGRFRCGPEGRWYGRGPAGGRPGCGPEAERYGQGPACGRYGRGPMGGFPPRPAGPMAPPPRRQPAFRPGFVPEEERREHYESLSLGDRITFQIQALAHMLNRLPESRDGQRRVLEILMDRGSLSQRELMELCEIRSGSLSELIARMESGGYIVRFPNPRDRRTLDVSLTEAGLVAAQALRSRRQDLYEGISQEDREALLRALEALNAHFRQKLFREAVPLGKKTEV